MATSKISLTLIIDPKSRKVLYAEAGKDFVDLLFSLLSLPVGTVTRLLTKQNMVGSLGDLVDSIEELNQTKDSILNPQKSICAADVPLLLTDGISVKKTGFTCAGRHGYWTDNSKATCPSCSQLMTTLMPYIAPKQANKVPATDGGFVKGVVIYMVLDNLKVKPLSTLAITTLINQFNVKEMGFLEERMVDLTIAQGLKLLRFSLQSKTVLTNVFLGN